VSDTLKSWEHEVKCPRCKRVWILRDRTIRYPPKYRYCKPCARIERETGRALGRAKITKSREIRPDD